MFELAAWASHLRSDNFECLSSHGGASIELDVGYLVEEAQPVGGAVQGELDVDTCREGHTRDLGVGRGGREW